mmetsp:Transcript_1938/g.2762  ORF Transcript_1938/g.2762 Transcript_1938/m.2762 type:complete len:210 (+) Transcript_1938:251-880(+)
MLCKNCNVAAVDSFPFLKPKIAFMRTSSTCWSSFGFPLDLSSADRLERFPFRLESLSFSSLDRRPFGIPYSFKSSKLSDWNLFRSIPASLTAWKYFMPPFLLNRDLRPSKPDFPPGAKLFPATALLSFGVEPLSSAFFCLLSLSFGLVAVFPLDFAFLFCVVFPFLDDFVCELLFVFLPWFPLAFPTPFTAALLDFFTTCFSFPLTFDS